MAGRAEGASMACALQSFRHSREIGERIRETDTPLWATNGRTRDV
jgi:hypothetical protein